MAKMFRILLTSEQRTPPRGLFRPCVLLESGEYAQIEEDKGTYDEAALACTAYAYGRPAYVISCSGEKLTP